MTMLKEKKDRNVEEEMVDLEKDVTRLRTETEQGKSPKTEQVLQKIIDFRMMWSVLSPPQ